jgi:hypothetical protein
MLLHPLEEEEVVVMKTLIATLASLALAGCGGLDESALPAGAGEAETAVLQNPPMAKTQLDEPLPMPEEGKKWAVIWSRGGDALQLVQVPVEERFFHPVDVNVPPPELPTPPCPSCR